MNGKPSSPDNLKITLSELSHLLGISEYIIRFWVKEFSDIGFITDNRFLFDEEAVKMAKLLKRFIYHEYFTIKGARRRFQDVDILNDEDIVETKEFENNLIIVKREVEELLSEISKAIN